jgi:uncharacterized protein YecE (DUF72 family)
VARSYIGASGWNYKHWGNGEFYPRDLKPADWLKFYAGHFNTVEINNSFYRLPTEDTFKNWRKQVPRDFKFSVKASRFITHVKRLKDPEEPLDLFFSRAKHLKDHLGPVLFQLPPQLKLDIDRLEIFLRALKSHGAGKLRCSLEVRDATWLTTPVFDLLEKYGVALCLADWREMHVTGPVTANFVYVRRHYGRGKGGNYPKRDLDRDVNQIRKWMEQDLDVFMYFNNDMGGHAIRNTRYVQEKINSIDNLKPTNQE